MAKQDLLTFALYAEEIDDLACEVKSIARKKDFSSGKVDVLLDIAGRISKIAGRIIERAEHSHALIGVELVNPWKPPTGKSSLRLVK